MYSSNCGFETAQATNEKGFTTSDEEDQFDVGPHVWDASSLTLVACFALSDPSLEPSTTRWKKNNASERRSEVWVFATDAHV
jgi:hypothetical protein